jgi:hypothetical protein
MSTKLEGPFFQSGSIHYTVSDVIGVAEIGYSEEKRSRYVVVVFKDGGAVYLFERVGDEMFVNCERLAGEQKLDAYPGILGPALRRHVRALFFGQQKPR